MRPRQPGNRGVDPDAATAVIEVEVRMFNSLARYGRRLGHRPRVSLGAGATVADLLSVLAIPVGEVHLVLVNGRDITPGRIGAAVRTAHRLEDGDVVALSGPLPYTWK